MRLSLAAACVLGLAAAPAFAQVTAQPLRPVDTRLPIVVVDARGVFARFGQDLITAAGLSTSAVNLPSKGLGGVAGAHVYLVRGRSVSVGVGGEALLVRASHELTDSKGKPTGTVIHRRLRGVSGQFSMNFGRNSGWSYLTAGLGPTSFESYLNTAVPDGLRPMTLNFGGGARWFNFAHLAFTADLRFYRTKVAPATPNTAARAGKTVALFTGGIAIK